MKSALLAAAVAIAGPAAAQTFQPAPSQQEGQAPRPARDKGIGSALAVEAAQVAVNACAAQGLKVTTLVVDSVGAPIVMISGDGAAVITQRIASGKAVTSVKTGLPTGEVVAKARADQAYMASQLADPAQGFPRQGGVPIKLNGEMVGAIAVSGAPSGAQDETCARAGLAVIEGRLAGRAATPSASLDPAAISYVLPADLKWEGTGGSQTVKLYGDPDKPGPYGVIYKWSPGFNSQPHSHATDRFAYVISGTWWMSTSRTPDKSTLVPIPQGSFVMHKAGQVHWDGGVDNTAIILITGTGPVETKRVAP